MKVLAEGDLRKRCATLPMMRRRYCMLLLDDSNTSKLKVLLRSYKTKAERDGSADSFVSSHVVKCIGEWTGKGNLHTYPHAFVVETVQSKLFHCSAASSEAKRSWMHAIPFAEDGLYALVGPGVTPVLSSSSQDDAPTPNDAPMPASFRESTAITATPVQSTTPPPPRTWFARPSRASSRRQDLETPKKPPSVQDALFERKAKQTTKRDLVADLEIESDEEGAAPESLLLEPSLLGPKVDPYEVDVHIGYVPPAPMKLQFEVDPQAKVMHSVTPSNDSDEDDERVPMDPTLYARISQMRMDEAKEATRKPRDEVRPRRTEAEPRVARKVKAKKHKKKPTDASSTSHASPHHHRSSRASGSTSHPMSTSKAHKASPSPPAPRRTPPLPADDAPQPRAVRPAPLPPQKGPTLALPDIEGF
ncbi:hypothetical protein SPRG_09049 [Saprolegnia parasitica CBS 223.65]|uniref:PH domain-containing protein n=1 Tax=Saprolegnia parasitica (strain CBS 223.65) TaxID=695850 RepID=A0A067C9C9_SAPPC|nr:hypothetical protein SPRG_09049 [Saprolegnia parasitica CBS 223.65]KDO25750.1 hypothetical protein SPRG_09049 [Saprolegnia parasitica CBS 223.65]|eukprot:XP_012203559.1 hypothetical protein SPRG_09049 [Saprolegnia parasitica CBS 223.65]